METIGNFIGGESVAPVGGAYLDNYEPATGAVYSRVPDSDSRDIDHAVQAARAAFPAWAALTADERAKILNRLADRIEAKVDEFARAESIDGGKPITRARQFEIPRCVQNFRYFAAAVQHAPSEFFPMGTTHLSYVLRRARGVAGIISPWNLPLYLLTWKVAPALATGNTVVAKPSEVTPMTAHLLSQICREAGLPPGVLNIVHGRGGQAGAALVQHPQVPTISFTGGTATGRNIASVAAPMFKKVSLELGGKNPNIVFADAGPEALEASVMAAFANTGQICLCGSRLFVQEPAYDAFVAKFVERTRALRVGDPLEADTQVGSLVSADQLAKTSGYVKLAREEGGRLLVGGERVSPSDRCKQGYFHQPTAFAGLPPTSRVNQEEIFGPMVSIMPFRDVDEVVDAANSTDYGLSASVWTSNIDTAHRVAERLQSGTVWLNCWMVRDLRTPFGGVKQSGVGREGGDEGLRFFTEPKTVTLRVN